MTITMTPKLEKALSKEAQKYGTTPEQLALDRLSEFFDSEEKDEKTVSEAPEGSAYDLFAGRIGRIKGSKENYSQNCGERFTEHLLSEATLSKDVPTDDDEIFTLRSLARERMTAKVVKTQVSAFRYADDTPLK